MIETVRQKSARYRSFCEILAELMTGMRTRATLLPAPTDGGAEWST